VEGLLSNLIDPAILFFFLGLLIAAVRSNLEIPAAIQKFFSLYLLMAIGLKGGSSLAQTGFTTELGMVVLAAILLALVIPAYGYGILRRKYGRYDAAAIAATYGSVSAVTFIAANSYLAAQQIPFDGFMTVALVVMESPAIVMAVYLAARARQAESRTANNAPTMSMKDVLHEAFTDGAHLLLLGSMLVGYLSGETGAAIMKPFTGDIFKGILAFFLLEMGLLVARRLRESKSLSKFAVLFALIFPLVNAGLGLGIAMLFQLSLGNSILLMTLAASGSYIVVPAVIRYAIPEANPSLYFAMTLGITFPMNIVLGIPFYNYLARQFIGGM